MFSLSCKYNSNWLRQKGFNRDKSMQFDAISFKSTFRPMIAVLKRKNGIVFANLNSVLFLKRAENQHSF